MGEVAQPGASNKDFVNKLISQLIGTSTLLLCLACVDTETVYDSVKHVYQELREQKAQALYQKRLDALSEPQRKITEQAVPHYISVPPPEN